MNNNSNLKSVVITHLQEESKIASYYSKPDIVIKKEFNKWYENCEKVYVKDGALILLINNNGNKKEIGFSLAHIVRWEINLDE